MLAAHPNSMMMGKWSLPMLFECSSQLHFRAMFLDARVTSMGVRVPLCVMWVPLPLLRTQRSFSLM